MLVRWLTIVIGALVVVVAIGAGLLAWYDGPRIQAQLTKNLAEKHGVVMEIDRLQRSYSIFPLVQIDGLRVANAKHPDETLIEVNTARFRAHPLSFIVGPLTFDGIEIDGARIAIPVDGDGAGYWEPVVDAISAWLHRFDWSLEDFVIGDLTLDRQHRQYGSDLLVSAQSIRGRMPRLAELTIDARNVKANLETTLPLKLHGTASLDSVVLDRIDGDLPMSFAADGHIEEKALRIRATGGNLLDGDSFERDPVEGSISVANRTARFTGSMSRDDDLHVDVDVSLDLPGDDGDVPVTARMHVSDPMTDWRLSDMHVERGDATLDGVIHISKSEGRRFFGMTFNLNGVHYPWHEEPVPDEERGDRETDIVPGDDLYASLLDFVGRFDADIRIAAKESSVYGIPFSRISTRASVIRGLFGFTVDDAAMLDGNLSARIAVEPDGDITSVRLEAALRDAQLSTLTAKAGMLAGTTGAFNGDINLHGSGRETGAVLHSLDGRALLYMQDGAIPEKVATWMAGDIVTALLTDFEQNNTTAVNCAIVDFAVDSGKATSQQIVLDAGSFTLYGDGNIDLGEQSLNIELVPHAKDFSLLSIRLPVEISGEFGDLAVDTKKIRALASLLTPIELGSGKDADCNAVGAAIPDTIASRTTD